MKIYKDALLDWQREYITTAIEKCDGSMIKAAQMLGFNRTHFYLFCDRIGIKRKDQRPGRKSTVNRGNEAWQALGRMEHVS